MMAAQTDMMFQNPTPGTHLLRFAGDLQRFTLDLKAPESGTAWLRTNIGWAGMGRREIVDAVERDKAILGRDWFDIPMVQTGAGRFEVGVPFEVQALLSLDLGDSLGLGVRRQFRLQLELIGGLEFRRVLRLVPAVTTARARGAAEVDQQHDKRDWKR